MRYAPTQRESCSGTSVANSVATRHRVGSDAAPLAVFAFVALALPVVGSSRGWYGSIIAHVAAFVVGIFVAVACGIVTWRSLHERAPSTK